MPIKSISNTIKSKTPVREGEVSRGYFRSYP